MLQNIVATVNLGCQIDLRVLSEFGKYNPQRFSACILRIKTPKSTALVFAKGKITCLGTKSIEDAKQAVLKFFEIIKNAGFLKAKLKNFKIRNLVGSYNLKRGLNLREVYATSNMCHYEPEIFPGLSYRLEKPKVTAVIFHTGKFHITGAQTTRELDEAFDFLYPILLNCCL